MKRPPQKFRTRKASTNPKVPTGVKKSFDQKFGDEFMASIPTCPGVYRIFDAAGTLIYIGKAKNLRRRLSQYRNAKRRKKHRKMKQIVIEAERLEFELCPSDLDACLLEARLIQEHRPRWNVAGAFYFLYPLVGMRVEQGVQYFCLTNQPALYPDYAFQGAYRSRNITGAAFFALMKLLSYVGHPVPRKKLAKEIRGTYCYAFAFSRLSEDSFAMWGRFWKGESSAVFEDLVLSLIENAHARKRSKKVQEGLNLLKLFWRFEAVPLRKAREKTGFAAYPVPQKERDFLFLRARAGVRPPEPSAVQVQPG